MSRRLSRSVARYVKQLHRDFRQDPHAVRSGAVSDIVGVGPPHALHTHGWPRLETGPRHQQNCTDCHQQNAGPVRFEPQESHAAPWRLQSVANREEYGPLSGPRQIAVRAAYKIPPRTSSAPSSIRNILASQFIVAAHNRTEIQDGALRLVPELLGRPCPQCLNGGRAS